MLLKEYGLCVFFAACAGAYAVARRKVRGTEAQRVLDRFRLPSKAPATFTPKPSHWLLRDGKPVQVSAAEMEQAMRDAHEAELAKSGLVNIKASLSRLAGSGGASPNGPTPPRP